MRRGPLLKTWLLFTIHNKLLRILVTLIVCCETKTKNYDHYQFKIKGFITDVKTEYS